MRCLPGTHLRPLILPQDCPSRSAVPAFARVNVQSGQHPRSPGAPPSSLALASAAPANACPSPPCAQATQSFNVGEGPERAAVTAARARGLEIPPDFAARQFDPGADMARCDLVLVMDKFTASDVLREASGLAVGFGGLTPWVSADAEQGRANTGVSIHHVPHQ